LEPDAAFKFACTFEAFSVATRDFVRGLRRVIGSRKLNQVSDNADTRFTEMAKQADGCG
jgi:hypothetical protein